MMMENRRGVDGVDGDGPNRNGLSDRRRRRARDGRHDGACSSSVKAARRRRWRIAAAASASTATAQIAMSGTTGVGARAMASATTRATHPLLSELRALNLCPTAPRRGLNAVHLVHLAKCLDKATSLA